MQLSGTMKNPLFVILLAAFTARLITTFFYPMIYHPDELYQYYEQGYRLVEGYGVVPWEYIAGIRSWIVPGILAGFKLVTDVFSDNPLHYFYLPSLFFSLISLLAVYVFYKKVGKMTSNKYALVATFIPAFFPIYVSFAPRVLTAVIAGHLLLFAVYLLNDFQKNKSWRFYFLLGMLLGFVFILRFHIAFAIALPVLYLLVKDGWSKKFVYLVLGGVLVVLASGLLDWITWGQPFQSITKNIYMNAVLNIASEFGEIPLELLIDVFPGNWVGIIVVLALCLSLFVKGWRGNELFALMFLGAVIPHLFIGHKEFRFFYPAVTPFLIIASVGAYRFFRMLPEHRRKDENNMLTIIFATTVIIITLGSYNIFNQFGWFEKGRKYFDIAAELRKMDNLEMVGTGGNLWMSYALLGKNIPIYVDSGGEENFRNVNLLQRKLPFEIKVVDTEEIENTTFPSEVIECFERVSPRSTLYEFCLIEVPTQNIDKSVKLNTLNESLMNNWENVHRRLLDAKNDQD